jgi:hypothetical protein
MRKEKILIVDDEESNHRMNISVIWESCCWDFLGELHGIPFPQKSMFLLERVI